jgi:6-phosphogluconate dehydrogenase
VVGTHSTEELVKCPTESRRVMLIVKASDFVDQTIDQVVPFLEEGDIIIDDTRLAILVDGSQIPVSRAGYVRLKS